MDPLAYQAAIGMAVPWLIERLKPWMPKPYLAALSRLASVAAAVATAAGIQVAAMESPRASSASVCLVIPEWAMFDLLARAVLQYGAQELVYRGAVKSAPAAAESGEQQ